MRHIWVDGHLAQFERAGLVFRWTLLPSHPSQRCPRSNLTRRGQRANCLSRGWSWQLPFLRADSGQPGRRRSVSQARGMSARQQTTSEHSASRGSGCSPTHSHGGTELTRMEEHRCVCQSYSLKLATHAGKHGWTATCGWIERERRELLVPHTHTHSLSLSRLSGYR